MRPILVVVLMLLGLSGSAFADQPWAPGAKSAGGTSGGFKMPPLVLRLGVTLASTNVQRYVSGNRLVDVSFSGIQLEAAIRTVTVPVGTNAEFMLDIPLVFSVLQGKASGEETTVMLLGRGIPTARLRITRANGMTISPFIGFGAGAKLNSSGGVGNDIQGVWVYRLGLDLMFNQSRGVGIGLTRNSVDEWTSYRGSFGWVLKELSLSYIIKL